MNFTPHPKYSHLLSQARALAALMEAKESEARIWERKYRAEVAKKRPISQAELDSERAANARLTEELRELRKELENERIWKRAHITS